jgi:hypothetical protein
VGSRAKSGGGDDEITIAVDMTELCNRTIHGIDRAASVRQSSFTELPTDRLEASLTRSLVGEAAIDLIDV